MLAKNPCLAMASFEDYDEFGNYIGADLISDDEDEDVPQNTFRTTQETFQTAPLEGYEDDSHSRSRGECVDGN